MARTRNYQSLNKRMQFRCFECGFKKQISVGLHLRRKTVKCNKCSETTKCVINRRHKLRNHQTGKAILITPDGSEWEISLHNVSQDGIGFELPFGEVTRSKKIKIGQEVSFRCAWNPRLFDQSRFVVKYIREHRIGAEKLR